MVKKDTYSVVKNIIATTFNIDENKITSKTSSDEVEEWDSLGHIRLILQLESEFNIKFNSTIIPKLTSIQAIISEMNKISLER